MITLTYVGDAYCGWCYGFGPAVRDLAGQEAVSVSIVPGSLFTGDRVVPIRNFGHVPEANARIAALTGVTFGPEYQELLAAGDVAMDSDAAARGLQAVISVAGEERGLEAFIALQEAFYLHGLSLSSEEAYVHVAKEMKVDEGKVVAALTDPEVIEAARAQQRWARDVGVDHYPTLLLHTADGLVEVGSPTATAEQIREQIDRELAARS